MKQAYHATNSVDAQLVVDLLASEGIPAFVQGHFLSGAIGELPAGELVRVWVADEDLGHARELLAEREAWAPLSDDDFVPAPVEPAPDGESLAFAGHRLFARSGGQGAPLLLIHGFPTSSRDWDGVWDALAGRFELHAIDMLGFGRSDKPSDFDYTIMASADQWEALARWRGLGEVHVLAHDYGDTVAQELLARQRAGRLPFRILSVAFLNGGLFPEATHPLLLQRALLGPLGPLVAHLASERSFAASMRRICARPPPAADLHEHWQLVARADGRAVMPKIIRYIRERAAHRERWVGALQSADVPICLVDGVHDPISGASIVRRWRELLPAAPAVELEGVGHYPQWEAPDRVVAALLAWPGWRSVVKA